MNSSAKTAVIGDMKNRREVFLKTGTAIGLGAIASILPSQIGLSTASASTKVVKKAMKKVVHPKTTGKTGSFLGQVAQTQFGPVQVKVIVSHGRITKVVTPIYPTGTFRDREINSQAIPMLEREVIQVQSSNIQGIGGASYTSQGFYTSLVSALAKAGHK
jgi:uncharacterized protein with FMN-binding domain